MVAQGAGRSVPELVWIIFKSTCRERFIKRSRSRAGFSIIFKYGGVCKSVFSRQAAKETFYRFLIEERGLKNFTHFDEVDLYSHFETTCTWLFD